CIHRLYYAEPVLSTEPFDTTGFEIHIRSPRHPSKIGESNPCFRTRSIVLKSTSMDEEIGRMLFIRFLIRVSEWATIRIMCTGKPGPRRYMSILVFAKNWRLS